MGIHDRDYMRPEGKPSLLSRLARVNPAVLLIVVLVLAFAVQTMAMSSGHEQWIFGNFALTGGALKAGKFWTLLTASFLHSGIFHLIFNGIGIWCLGRGVAVERGEKRFWQVYFAGVLAGSLTTALIWAMPSSLVSPKVLEYRDLVPTVGASTGVLALMGYYLADKLKEVFSILIYFIIPVRIEGAWLLGVTAGLSVLGLVFSEIPLATGWWHVGINDLSVSHSGHLGGLLLGFGWARLAMRRAAAPRIIEYREPDARRERPERRERPRPAKAVSVETSAPGADTDMRGEVDRILDKINAQGFGALTAEERALLEKARETLGRR